MSRLSRTLTSIADLSINGNGAFQKNSPEGMEVLASSEAHRMFSTGWSHLRAATNSGAPSPSTPSSFRALAESRCPLGQIFGWLLIFTSAGSASSTSSSPRQTM